MQEPRIVEISTKRLIGISAHMSLSDNKTYQLWRRFMPRKKEIEEIISEELFSVQIYDNDFLNGAFTPQTLFQKWAAVQVLENTSVPEAMEELVIPAGRYAVFVHKGPASSFPSTAQYIYGEWLPKSDYQLADQPHFEVMGEKYLGHDNPESEEEVWIPLG